MGRLIDEDVLLKNLEWLEDYDHYVLHDIESTLEETPTVKAIPVEWIEMFLEENYPIESPYGTKAYFHDFMKRMIKEWEKENEN